MKTLPRVTGWLLCGWLLLTGVATAAEAPTIPIGLAREDITPKYGVRLTGYNNRTAEATVAKQKLYAKAMALGADDQKPAVIITVDNLGIPAAMTEEVSDRLMKKAGIELERLAICASHTHSAPALSGTAGLILNDLTDEQRQHIEQYAEELTDALERVALAALADRRPAQLSYSEGRADFAMNRRVIVNGRWMKFGVEPGGMVDHSMLMLQVTDPEGKLRGVLVNYACHCTTLGGNFNEYFGDWAGCAQEAIERELPGTMAMIAIGCGADSNPEPRGELSMAVQHGEAVAREVKRLVGEKQLPLGQVTSAVSKEIDLPFDTLPSRAEYEARAQQKGPIAKHAQAQLARLNAGEKLATFLGYRLQTWLFGDELAMVFMPGEVTVDYALRLNRECDNRRLWITAYANDEPCYIASERVLGEGGYEVDSSMYYYDWPTHFAPTIEDQIVAAVKEILPADYRAAEAKGTSQWQGEIDKLLARDEPQATQGKIVFIGSSSIRRWDLAQSFPDLPVVNHGFGGSEYRDAIFFADRLLADYRPKTVVIYSGDNDINSGKSPEQVANDGVSLIRKVRKALPEARIVTLSIKPSPKRWKLYSAQQRANQMLSYYIKSSGDRRLLWVDGSSTLLGDDGMPRPDCYVADGVHMTDAGYARWVEVLRPYLLDDSSGTVLEGKVEK